MGFIAALIGKWIGHLLVVADREYGRKTDRLESSIDYYKKYDKWPDYMSLAEIQQAIKLMQKREQKDSNKWR